MTAKTRRKSAAKITQPGSSRDRLDHRRRNPKLADPAELGEQPAHVRVERFLPQSELLASCDAVVSHAGSGTVIGALAYGVPLVLLPMGADQPLNADRCESLGVARVLDASLCTSAEVREAVQDVLVDPSYRSAAGRLGEEAAALPGYDQAAELLQATLDEEGEADHLLTEIAESEINQRAIAAVASWANAEGYFEFSRLRALISR